jgi:ABC-type glycerol-3-phosphate transport system permease component
MGKPAASSLAVRPVRPRFRVALGPVLWYVVLLLVAIGCLLPFFWMISVSLRSDGREITVPVEWLPTEWVWQNYLKVNTLINLPLLLRNTLIMAGSNTLGSALVGSLVAFAFARLRFPGRDLLFSLVLSTMMLPSAVTLLPNFVINRELGWINNLYPFVIGPFLGGGAFNIFLFRQFYGSIPKELDEAAMIDGAGALRIWWAVMIPLSGPVLTVVAIFAFFASWNDFITPLIYLTNQDLFPLALGLYSLGGSSAASFTIPHYNTMMSGATILVLPVIVLFFFTQRYFMRGIQIAGVMGK